MLCVMRYLSSSGSDIIQSSTSGAMKEDKQDKRSKVRSKWWLGIVKQLRPLQDKTLLRKISSPEAVKESKAAFIQTTGDIASSLGKQNVRHYLQILFPDAKVLYRHVDVFMAAIDRDKDTVITWEELCNVHTRNHDDGDFPERSIYSVIPSLWSAPTAVHSPAANRMQVSCMAASRRSNLQRHPTPPKASPMCFIRARCRERYFKDGVLLPDTIVTRTWDFLRLALSMFNFIVVPLQIASFELQTSEAVEAINWVGAELADCGSGELQQSGCRRADGRLPFALVRLWMASSSRTSSSTSSGHTTGTRSWLQTCVTYTSITLPGSSCLMLWRLFHCPPSR